MTDEQLIRLDDISDRLGLIYRKVGALEPRLGGDGRQCIKIMDELLSITEEVEIVSDRKTRLYG